MVADAIATFFTATDAAAVDVLRPRNPNLLLTGTAAAAATTDITGVAVSNPAGAAIADLLTNGDAVAVRVVGATTDELQMVTTVGGTVKVAPGLPAAFGGQAVEIRRCDAGIVKLSKDDDSLARTIAIIRGTSAHVARQVPDDFFDSGDVEVEEFLPGGRAPADERDHRREQLVVDFADGDALAPYVTGDVVRILSAGTYFARVVTGTRPAGVARPRRGAAGRRAHRDGGRPTVARRRARRQPGRRRCPPRRHRAGHPHGAEGVAVHVRRHGGAAHRHRPRPRLHRRRRPGRAAGRAAAAGGRGAAGPGGDHRRHRRRGALVTTAAGGAAKFQTGQPVEVRAGGAPSCTPCSPPSTPAPTR